MSTREAMMADTPAAPPPLTCAVLRERAAQLLPAIGKDAARRERERELPHGPIRELAAAQLLAFRIPAEHGGAGSSVPEVVQFIVDLAAVDSNVAQALRSGFAFIEGLRASDSEDERRRWFPRYLAGDVFGNAGWEVGGANGAISARITPDGEHFRVNGSKYYSTVALYADWISTVALGVDDQPVAFTLPSNREGVSLLDDFDAMGQRLTASGTTRLDNVLVHSHKIRRRNPSQGRPASRAHTISAAPNRRPPACFDAL